MACAGGTGVHIIPLNQQFQERQDLFLLRMKMLGQDRGGISETVIQNLQDLHMKGIEGQIGGFFRFPGREKSAAPG